MEGTLNKGMISEQQQKDLLILLKVRFVENVARHHQVMWDEVEAILDGNINLLRVIYEMEASGGEPDLLVFEHDQYYYVDCSKETPLARRRLSLFAKKW